MGTVFETETCSRCAGTGTHSYCQSYGNRCFKCRGQKRTYTKKGQVAKNYYRQLCEVLVSDIKVGDLIISGSVKGRVLKIRDSRQQGSNLIDGVMVPYDIEISILETDGTLLYIPKTSKVVIPNKDNIAKALEYQSKLTKKGKLMKKYQNEEEI